MRLTPRLASLSTIPQALRSCQGKHGWNQEKMANELGLTMGHYSEVLNGKRRLPYPAACIAFTLGVPAKVLLALQNVELRRESRDI